LRLAENFFPDSRQEFRKSRNPDATGFVGGGRRERGPIARDGA